jgi:hypothetical protein
MKYLSFSLWGDNPIYNIGAIRNAELKSEIYADWQMVVFYDSSVPKETIDKLNSYNVLCKDMTENTMYGMFWRFLAVDLPNATHCIFRDCDSRISKREEMAVFEWIESNATLHIMRDHILHQIPAGNDGIGILGGMWGIKNGEFSMYDLILKYPENGRQLYGNDQKFLKDVYYLFENDKCVHDEFFEQKPFPIPRENGRYVGQRIDENENPIDEF